MEYYVVSPNIYNDGDNYAEQMYLERIAAVGWSENAPKGNTFKKIQIGDVIIVALRSYWEWYYYYAGIVVGDVQNPQLGKLAKNLSPIIKLDTCQLNFEKWSANGSNQIPSPQRIKKEENKSIIKKLNLLFYMKKFESILLNNHNLILTGAPGTGKTYLAKQIAQQMIFGSVKEEKDFTEAEKQQFKEQCGFVQFHPSYDYTDFVEGLRPIQDDNGNVGFERKDGVFKEFCKKAEKNWIDSKKSIDVLQKEFYNKELIDSFLSNAINEETIYKTKTGTEFNIADFDDDIISIKILRNKIRGNIDIDININKHKIFKLLENDVSLNNVRDIKQFFGYTNTQHRDSYIFTICNEIRNLPKVNSVQIDPIVCKNFVFIIDEINRGEISKIFGELFFSIDPGYRGKNGKVKTQYQNLIEVGDEFYDGFFVPENVYIIGTMNDIDRSVESMDFAFRRRFAFKEIKADDNIEMLEELGELKDEAIERMKRLNAEISKIEGLSSAYHIGAAYFLKLKNYAGDADGGFENLWNNHLEGLLREYLRGSLNIEESIAKLEAAYNNESPENNG